MTDEMNPPVYHRIDVATYPGYVFTESMSNDVVFRTTIDSNQRTLFGSVTTPEPALVIRSDATIEVPRLVLRHDDDFLTRHAVIDTKKALHFLNGDLGNGSNALVDWLQYQGGSNTVADLDMDPSGHYLYVTGNYSSNAIYFYDRMEAVSAYTLSNDLEDNTSVFIASYATSNASYMWSTAITANGGNLNARAIRTNASHQVFVAGSFSNHPERVVTFSHNLNDPNRLFVAASNTIPSVTGFTSYISAYTHPLDIPTFQWFAATPGICRDIDVSSNAVFAVGDDSNYAFVFAFDSGNGSLLWHKQLGSNLVLAHSLRYDACESPKVRVAARVILSGQTELYTFSASNGDLLAIQLFESRLDGPNANEVQATSMTFDPTCRSLYVLDSFNKPADSLSPYVNPETMTVTQDILLSKYQLDSSGNLYSQEWQARAAGYGKDIAHSIFTNPYGDVYFTGHYQNRIDIYDGFGAIHSHLQETASNSTDAAFICKLSAQGHMVFMTQLEGVSMDTPVLGTADANGHFYLAGTQNADPLTIHTTLSTTNVKLASRMAPLSEGFIVKYNQDSIYYLLHDSLRDTDNGFELSLVNSSADRYCIVHLGDMLNTNNSSDPYLFNITSRYFVQQACKRSFVWYEGNWHPMVHDTFTEDPILRVPTNLDNNILISIFESNVEPYIDTVARMATWGSNAAYGATLIATWASNEAYERTEELALQFQASSNQIQTIQQALSNTILVADWASNSYEFVELNINNLQSSIFDLQLTSENLLNDLFAVTQTADYTSNQLADISELANWTSNNAWTGNTSLIPAQSSLYDIGSSTSMFRNAYFSGTLTVARLVFDDTGGAGGGMSIGSSGTAGLPTLYKTGLRLSYRTATIIEVSPGKCRSIQDNYDLAVYSAQTLDITSSADRGGNLTDGAWYNVYIISNGTNVVAWMNIQTDINLVNLPSGYVYYRRIGAIQYIDLTDGIRRFTHMVDNSYTWHTSIQEEIHVDTTGSGNIQLTLPSIVCNARVRLQVIANVYGAFPYAYASMKDNSNNILLATGTSESGTMESAGIIPIPDADALIFREWGGSNSRSYTLYNNGFQDLLSD